MYGVFQMFQAFQLFQVFQVFPAFQNHHHITIFEVSRISVLISRACWGGGIGRRPGLKILCL